MAQPTQRNYAYRGHHKQYALLTPSKPQKHMVPTAVLTQSKPVSNTVVRPVSAALPNITVTQPRNDHHVVTKFKSPIRRHITHSPSLKTSNSPPRVTAVQALVVSVAQGNMSYLSEFEELNGGYVAFGGNPKGGTITGKCKIKTGKQHRASCKTKPVSSVDQPLFRLHLDLFGPTFAKRINKKSYCLVITDDYSRFIWVFFLATKDETSPILKTFITGLENQLSLKVKVIRSDNEIEFKNSDLNQTLIEAARTMLADSLLPIPFWAEAVNTACYVQNRVFITKPYNKTPYELLHGKTPSIGFMRPFGCLVTILNTLDPLGKFQRKVDEGFIVGYSVCSKAFRVFNSRTRIIQETLHVNFLENKPNVAGTGPTWLFDIDSLTRTMNYQPVTAGNQTNYGAGFQDKFDAKKVGEEVDQTYVLFPVWSPGSINPQNNDEDTTFDGKEHDFDAIKPESVVILSSSSSAQSRKQDDKIKKEDKRKRGTQEGTSSSKIQVGLKQCKKSFFNSRCRKNKARLVAQRHTQEEGIDYEEVFPVARIKAIRLFLAYASFMSFMVYQMDVNSSFLCGTIEEEVYVCQPLGFKDPDHPAKVYKVVKALYDLHQDLRAWYETLATYLLENGFQR
nr:hypothetical protein [Tanacetum cinerariifolium]